ncbi:MAG: DUF1844 domain-containing protein [Acidobacteriota bacterium]
MSEKRDRADTRGPIRVVDRRPFTAEGAPRTPDDAGEGEAWTAPTPPTGPGDRGGGAAGAADAEGAPTGREEQLASARFRNLILNLAATAAVSLGEIPNPQTRTSEIDLEGAQQVIDLLEALRLKTRGNRTAEETGLLDRLIHDLQLQFVTVKSKTPRPS